MIRIFFLTDHSLLCGINKKKPIYSVFHRKIFEKKNTCKIAPIEMHIALMKFEMNSMQIFRLYACLYYQQLPT